MPRLTRQRGGARKTSQARSPGRRFAASLRPSPSAGCVPSAPKSSISRAIAPLSPDRHEDSRAVQHFEQFGARIGGRQHGFAARQHAAEFRRQDEIGGAARLRQHMQIRQIQEFAEPLFRLQRQEMNIGQIGAVLHQTRFFRAVSGNDEMHVPHAGELPRRVDHHVEGLFRADVAGVKNDEVGAAQAELRAKHIRSASGLILARSTQLRTNPIRSASTPLAIRRLRIWSEIVMTPEKRRSSHDSSRNKMFFRKISLEMADRESGVDFEILHMEDRAGASKPSQQRDGRDKYGRLDT